MNRLRLAVLLFCLVLLPSAPSTAALTDYLFSVGAGTATDMAAKHAPSYTQPALRGVAPEEHPQIGLRAEVSIACHAPAFVR